MKIDDLIDRLEPFAQGCFSGNIDEWPQLKPLLREIFESLVNLSRLENVRYPVCPFCGTNIDRLAKSLSDKTGDIDKQEFFKTYPPGAGWDNPGQE